MNYKEADFGQVGNKLKTLRESSNMSQDELAGKCGLTSKTISSIELGKSNPTLYSIGKICKVLNVRIESVLY